MLEAPRKIRVRPNGPLDGVPRLPGSKSIAQRVLLWAGFAEGTTLVDGAGTSEDVLSTIGCLDALGCIPRSGGRSLDDRLRVVGRPVPKTRALELAIGESGTLGRLLLGLLGTTSGARAVLRPSGTLAHRSSKALVDALRFAGARLTGQGFEQTVEGGAGSPPWKLVRPTSSQEVSALLGALAARGGGVLEVEGRIPSRPYVDLTVDCLRRFGVAVEEEHDTIRIAGGLRAPTDPWGIEPDASAAGTALAAAATSAGRVCVEGLGSTSSQGDVRVIDHLAAFGVETRATPTTLEAHGAPTRGAELDLADTPDLAPPLAMVAARAAHDLGATSRLDGLATLRGKESDRVAALADCLSAANFAVRSGSDWLVVGPGKTPPAHLRRSALGDHRIAFALVLLGTFACEVTIEGADCVSKSWQGSFDSFLKLGADVS